MVEFPLDILLIEDNMGDVRLIQECLAESNVSVHLHAVSDGLEAMRFLRQEGRSSHPPRPDLIVLDLNLPRMSGQEVLAEIKADPTLKSIPVTVFTSSRVEDDIRYAQDQGVTAYINKPMNYEELRRTIEAMVQSWLVETETFQR